MGNKATPKVKVTLSEAAAERLEVPERGQARAWDSKLTGFGVKVKTSGRRAWIVRYRTRDGRQRELTLGEVGRLKADDARKEARAVLAAADKGEDPAEERRDAREAGTVRELAERWRREHAPKLKASTVKRAEGLLDRVILPSLGRLPVGSVTRADVAAMHHRARKTPTEANRAVDFARKLFNLAERWGLRPDGSNPCRHVDRFKELRRERFLSPAELGKLGDALRAAEVAREGLERVEAEYRAAQGEAERARLRGELLELQRAAEHPSSILAVRLLILTGCRRSEVLRLRWSEVDLEAGRLVLPDSKTGAKTVPLGAAALKVLAGAERLEGNPFVCWGDGGGAAFVGIDKAWRRIRSAAKRAVLEGLEPPADSAEAAEAVEAVGRAWDVLRLHDLRHSFASVGAAGGESLYVVGKVLGHSQPSTTARYAHLAQDPARAAADRISATIAAHLEGGAGGEVVDLGEARRSGRGGGAA